jgi:hypothetical protein
MSRNMKPVFSSLCLSLFLFAASPATAQTPNKPADDQEATLKTLINEVRLLRLTLERTNLAAFRSQIIMERLRVQQNNVNLVSRDLEDVRKQIVDMKITPEEAQQMLEEAQEGVNAGILNPIHLKATKHEIEQQTQREQKLLAREGALAAQLENERNKLREIEGRLDILERLLESTEPDAKPAKPNKKR